MTLQPTQPIVMQPHTTAFCRFVMRKILPKRRERFSSLPRVWFFSDRCRDHYRYASNHEAWRKMDHAPFCAGCAEKRVRTGVSERGLPHEWQFFRT